MATAAQAVEGKASSKSLYQQNYFRTLVGRGTSCSEAASQVDELLDQWRGNLVRDESITRVPGFERFVGLANIEIHSCGKCALTSEHDARVACLGKVRVEHWMLSEKENKEATVTKSGKFHGRPLLEFPWFAGMGKGLDCFEATHKARVELFHQIAAGNFVYEYEDIDWLNCTCDHKKFPFRAECRARIEAYSYDIRGKG